jgi:hypothetical protein
MMPSLHQLVVEEHYVLPDGLPADVQLIGGEVRVGIAIRPLSSPQKSTPFCDENTRDVDS